MTLSIPLLVLAVAGVLVYALAGASPKAAELGRLVFFAAFLALCLALGGGTLKL